MVIEQHTKQGVTLPGFPPKSERVHTFFFLYMFKQAHQSFTTGIGRVTGKSLVKRKFGLNKYIDSIIRNCGFYVPNLIDTLVAFLELSTQICIASQQPPTLSDTSADDFDLDFDRDSPRR